MGADDDVLVARMAAGDEDALAEVFDRHAGFLLGIARRVTCSDAMAEDALQEVLVALWRDPERYDATKGSLRAYLGMQAHRRAVDALRRDVRRKRREEVSTRLDEALQTASDDAFDGLTMAAAIRDAIQRLPVDQRRAVELAFWHGHTHREVATALNIPEGTAKSRLRLAQAKLAEWLAPAAEIR
ncbi:MAG TPA: sigma-70 family RNA polymerase sigma factor [Mycobacteriales bacterium]|nr:sigma-70 family RNA polymerase sigma factor [Mycobacteriales bacterium]